MYRRIRFLIYKEFLSLWRDKKSRFVLIAPPILQLFIFAFAATLDVTNVNLGVLNWDKGEKGFELLERFFHSKTFKKIIYLDTVNDIHTFLDNEKGMAVISLEESFSQDLDTNKTATIQCILNGRKSNTAQIVLGYITTIVQEFSAEKLIENGQKPTLAIVQRNWFNPNLIYRWFTIPGLLAILTMLEALMIVSLSLAREKELGNFDQLLVSPLEPKEILIGKTIPAVIIAMLEGFVIVFASILFFGLPFEGSLFLLLLSMLIYVLAIIGFGLFLSGLCNTQQQAVLGVFIFMTPAILLSGFASPIENMPEWLQYVTYANPARYFLKICRGLFMKGLPLRDILQELWPMLMIALVTLSGATLFLKKRLT